MTSFFRQFLASSLALFCTVLPMAAQGQETQSAAEVAKTHRFRIIIEEPEVTASIMDQQSASDMKRLEQKLDRVLAAQGIKDPAPSTESSAPAATVPAPLPDEAVATLTAAIQVVKDNANFVWIMLGGILVFNMQCGFAMLELGVCRAKNCVNVLMKNYLDFCIGAIVYLFIGFSLQFGMTWKGLVGWSDWWLSNFGHDHKIWIYWFFQVGFASVACTIVSGAMAERTKYLGYLIYSALFMVIIYPITGHWVWGSGGGAWGIGGEKGWLEAMGFIDFAGSSVVHACGGACALAGIIVVGARHGRFAKDGTPRILAGHNLPLTALGALLLWFGWFGFNAGSTLAANESIGRIAVNTLISPSAGALFAMISMWFMQGKPDVGIAINGSLGGAVAITAGCNNVSPASAFVIGLVAGLLTTIATIALERAKLDDVAGAVPVHLVNGWWGTLCVALFDEAGFNVQRLGVQALGTFSISVTAFIVCYIIFKVISLTIGLRADETEQIDGLDFSEHAVNAYPDFQTSEQT